MKRKRNHWMRRLRILLPAACLLLPALSSAQITFERTYGGIYDDWGHSVRQTSDGGYVITGWTDSFGVGAWDVYLIKTDSLGDTLWTRTYGGAQWDEGFSVQQTSDGGFIIAGCKDCLSGTGDVYLIKTDSSGDSLWTKTYNGGEDDRGYSVQETSDGGYIITGYRDISSFSYVYLVKTDSLGDTLWTRSYRGGIDAVGRSVQQTLDGGYVITGYTWGLGPNGWNVYLIKTDSLGDTLWGKTYGGDSEDRGLSVQQTSDGGFIITGYTWSFGAGNSDVYLIKTDSLGDTLWTRTFGGGNTDQGYSVQQTFDGGFIIGGYSVTYSNVYLIKTDSLGDTLWTRSYGSDSLVDWGYSVQQTLDGGYVIAGYTESFGMGGADVYLIKTDPSGNVVGIEEGNLPPGPCLFDLPQNYPNPFDSYTSIRYLLPRDVLITVAIYNIRGQLVRTLTRGEKSAGTHIVSWNGRDEQGRSLSSGIYFYQLNVSGGVKKTRKMLLLR